MKNNLSRREFLVFSGAALAGLSFAVSGTMATLENTAGRSSADRNSLKNIILIVMDTVRAQNMSLYGYQRSTTPNLERMTKSSIVFDHAISTAPWTLESHASMFTGRYPHELSAGWLKPLDHTFPVISEILAKIGYATAGFAANNVYCTRETGLARGFSHFEDYPISIDEILLSAELTERVVNNHNLRPLVNYYGVFNRKNAAEVNRSFVKWLSKNQKQSFFAFLNYFDAHEPVLPPAPYDRKFGTSLERRFDLVRYWDREGARFDNADLSEEDIQAEIDAYDGAIAYLDDHIGLLIDHLNELDVMDNTAVIITSDHGELFGEHELFSHGNSLYLPAIEVPLMMYAPGLIQAERRISTPVSLRDIPATLLDINGLDRTQIPGQSLLRYMDDDHTQAAVFAELMTGDPLTPSAEWKKARRTIVDREMHFIENGDGSLELYRYNADPQELVNIASDVGFQGVIEELMQQMKAYS